MIHDHIVVRDRNKLVNFELFLAAVPNLPIHVGYDLVITLSSLHTNAETSYLTGIASCIAGRMHMAGVGL